MFGRARQATIQSVQIHLAVVDHITAHHRALIEVNVIKVIHQPCRIIQILRRAFAVIQRDRIHDMHRCPCRAVMHATAR